MFDLGALLSLVAQKPEMAAQLDALGVPPPHPDMMKVGGPKPAEPLYGAGASTGPTTNLGDLMKGAITPSGDPDALGPSLSPHAIPRPASESQYSSSSPQLWKPDQSITFMPDNSPDISASGGDPNMNGGNPGPSPSMVGAPAGLIPPALAAAISSGGGGTSPGTNNPLQALAGLQGVKMPEPPRPIMQGGVSGGVKPPDMKAAAGASQQVLGTLLQALLMNHPGNPTVPQLGTLMR